MPFKLRFPLLLAPTQFPDMESRRQAVLIQAARPGQQSFQNGLFGFFVCARGDDRGHMQSFLFDSRRGACRELAQIGVENLHGVIVEVKQWHQLVAQWPPGRVDAISHGAGERGVIIGGAG